MLVINRTTNLFIITIHIWLKLLNRTINPTSRYNINTNLDLVETFFTSRDSVFVTAAGFVFVLTFRSSLSIL